MVIFLECIDRKSVSLNQKLEAYLQRWNASTHTAFLVQIHVKNCKCHRYLIQNKACKISLHTSTGILTHTYTDEGELSCSVCVCSICSQTVLVNAASGPTQDSAVKCSVFKSEVGREWSKVLIRRNERRFTEGKRARVSHTVREKSATSLLNCE